VGEAAMRAALPEVRKWLAAPHQPELGLTPPEASARIAPMAAD
jgi:hypothetical protein